MDLLNTILQAGGGDAVKQLAKQFNLGEGQISDVLGQVVPALGGGMQRNTQQSGGLDSLLGALQKGNHADYLDNPSKLADNSAQSDGNGILGHLLGSKDVSRALAGKASANTGISDSIIKKMLPMVASLAMGAVGKQQQAAPAASSSGGLGDLLGNLIDADKDGSAVDDLLGMAGKLFGR